MTQNHETRARRTIRPDPSSGNGCSSSRAVPRHRPIRKLGKLLLLSLVTLLLWGALSFLFASIPLRRVHVEGLTRYGEQEVLVTSGLSEIDKLSDVDAASAEQALLAFYPYFQSVHVRYVFPMAYRVEIVEEVPIYYTGIANDYFALSKELKVLERATSPRRFQEAGLQQITLGGVTSAMLGETLLCDGNYLEQVLRDIESSNLAGRIDNVHIGDRYHLSVTCDGLYTLYLGDINSIGAKLQLAALMIQDIQVPEGYSATLDVSNLKKTSIRYNGVQDSTLSAQE